MLENIPFFLQPGVKALNKSGLDENFQFKIINAVMDVNEIQKLNLVQKVKSYFGNNLPR